MARRPGRTGRAVRSRSHGRPFREDLLEAPLADLMAAAARRRDAAIGPPRHVLAQGVHPAHDAVPRPLRVLHVRQGAGPGRGAVPHFDEVLAIARRGAELGCQEVLFTLGEAPEARYPQAAAWLAEHGYASHRRLPRRDVAQLVLAETGLLPHANAGALDASRPRAAARGEPVAGDDDRDPRGAPRRARRPALRRARQDAGAPARDARGGRPRAGAVHHRDPRRDRRDARGTPRSARRDRAPRTRVTVTSRRSSSRTSCPSRAPRCTRPPACPPDELLWSIAVARLVLPAGVHLQAPPNLSDDLAPLLAAGIDDWGGVSPVTRRPREPGAALARARAAASGDRSRGARRWRRGSPSTPSSCAIPTRGSIPRCARRCSSPPTPRGSPATARGSPGRDDLEPPRAARVARPARAGERRRRGARRRVGRRRGRRRRDRHAAAARVARSRARSPRSPTSSAREIVGDDVTFVRNRNINYTNVCTFKCRFCAFSKGPLSLNLRGQPYLLEMEEMQRRVDRGGRVRRDRSVPPGRHPSRLRRRLLRRRCPRGEGSRAADPRARLHRARSDRRCAPARHAARATTSAG